MLEPRTPTEAATEEVLRRYLTRLALRYLPFAMAVVIFLVMVVTVPTRIPGSNSGLAAGAGGADAGGRNEAAAGAAAAAAEGPGAAVGPSSDPGAAAAAAGASSGPGRGAAARSTATTTRTGSASDVAVSGVTCGAGVRQVRWSAYTPACTPAFHGSNGGATAPGVNGTTITATYRISDSGEAAALAAAAPSLSTEAQHQYFEDLTTFVNYFNTQFELYGRKVVVKEFSGQGDWVREYQNQNAQGAQADAAKAKELGAFADISSTAVSTTPLYAQYLASNKIVSAGGVAASDKFFNDNAPYAYTVGASVSRLVDLVPNVVCQRMKGLPAIFAGDAVYKTTTRKFGMIYPTNPDFQVVGDAVKAALSACGVESAVTYEYALDLSTMASDSTNAMAQMHAAGVTTVICLCDTVVPKFLTQAADGQQYSPEWIDSAADSLAEGYSQSQWAHSIGASATAIDPTRSEASRVFKLAAPGKDPASVYYTVAYTSALLFFDTLQNAGPNLTAAAYQRGFFRLPATPGGELGPWEFGDRHYGPTAGTVISYWSPTAISGQTGKAGANQSCSGVDGQYHPWQPRSAYGQAGTQLQCQSAQHF